MVAQPAIQSAARQTSIPVVPAPRNIVETVARTAAIASDPIAYFSRLHAEYGRTFWLTLTGIQRVVVSSPEGMYDLFVGQAAKIHKSASYTDRSRGVGRFLGNGLLLSDGDLWKRQRKLVAPAFHHKRIVNYADTMANITADVVGMWHDGEALPMKKMTSLITMRVIARTMFDFDMTDMQNPDFLTVIDTVDAIQAKMGLISVPNWIPTPKELKARRSEKEIDVLLARLINERRASGEDRGDLLSMLIASRDEDNVGMDDALLRDELLTIFLAGYDTTSNALSWALYLLSQNPEQEARLHEETDRVLGRGKNARLPTLADLENLKYTDRVIKETLRIYPSAWAVGRRIMESTEIGGHYMPAGTEVLAAIVLTHRDPALYPDPMKFDPDRFTPENESKLLRGAYVPFSSGPRVCIGNSFASMEARLALATIVSRYTARPQAGYKMKEIPTSTLNPSQDMPMTVHAR